MPYWDKDKKKWRGTVFRSGHRKQEMFNLKSDAKEWEVGQKALPLRIPMIRTTDSEGKRPLIPIEGGHLFRVNPATLPNRKQC